VIYELLLVLVMVVTGGCAWILMAYGEGEDDVEPVPHEAIARQHGELEEPWTVLAKSFSASDVEEIRDALASRGVDCFTDLEAPSGLDLAIFSKHRVYVPRSQYRRGRALLRETGREQHLASSSRSR